MSIPESSPEPDDMEQRVENDCAPAGGEKRVESQLAAKAFEEIKQSEARLRKIIDTIPRSSSLV